MFKSYLRIHLWEAPYTPFRASSCSAFSFSTHSSTELQVKRRMKARARSRPNLRFPPLLLNRLKRMLDPLRRVRHHLVRQAEVKQHQNVSKRLLKDTKHTTTTQLVLEQNLHVTRTSFGATGTSPLSPTKQAAQACARTHTPCLAGA